jgi:cobalt-zinc-cadmium efflux system protein
MGGVASPHHLHLCQAGDHLGAMQAHVVVADGASGRVDAIKVQLAAKFKLQEVALGIECARQASVDPSLIGA